MRPTIGVLALAFTLCVSACGPSRKAGSGPRRDLLQADAEDFAMSDLCRTCHEDIDDQFRASMHFQSLADPVFRAVYYRKFLPAFHADPAAFAEERSCIECHSPFAFVESYKAIRDRTEKAGANVTKEECELCHEKARINLNKSMPGVECDVCHRIGDHTKDARGDRHYVLTPGMVKYGPLQYKDDFHREYLELQTRSELCATCHGSTNRHGVATSTTYEEWKESPYFALDIHCQDCHMNKLGFLTAGRPTYEAGQAAKMGMDIHTPTHSKISSHRFVGAHSGSQVEGALTLEFRVEGQHATSGGPLRFAVLVSNEKSGHRMPTGKVELRSVWLDVVARMGEDELPVQLEGKQDPYGVSGATEADEEVFGDDIPPGRRLYRVVFTDDAGEQTLIVYDAYKRAFDNRLPAGGRRIEEYVTNVPEEARGWIQLDATLYYLRYPQSFAKKLKVPTAVPVPFAWAKGEILVNK